MDLPTLYGVSFDFDSDPRVRQFVVGKKLDDDDHEVVEDGVPVGFRTTFPWDGPFGRWETPLGSYDSTGGVWGGGTYLSTDRDQVEKLAEAWKTVRPTWAALDADALVVEARRLHSCPDADLRTSGGGSHVNYMLVSGPAGARRPVVSGFGNTPRDAARVMLYKWWVGQVNTEEPVTVATLRIREAR